MEYKDSEILSEKENFACSPSNEPENNDSPVELEKGTSNEELFIDESVITVQPFVNSNQNRDNCLQESRVQDYLILSIFSIFCCCCLGFVSFAASIKCRNAKKNGDYEEARIKSSFAKKTAVCAIFFGTLAAVLSIIFRAVISSHTKSNDLF